MPDTPSPPTALTLETEPAERKPWHAPTLTEVALHVTGQASGSFSDGPAQTTE